MNDATLSHFALSFPPFGKDIPDGELFIPPSKQELIDELREALVSRESVLLTGEPGTGKTCVLRALRASVPQNGFRLTYCANATLGRRDFYRQLCTAMGLSPSATAAAVFHTLSTNVEELAKDRVHPCFLLDESHLLHQDVLDHLHILLNYHWDSQPLLSLVLIGLPELKDRLALRRNRSLHSRLHRRLHIDALTPDDTGAYLRLRMRRAGCDREVFSSDAIAMLHEATLGAMRDLDRLAHAALREACRRKKKLVERDHVHHALQLAA
jgi:type II secretory pathway predicted ATPase ExeA